MRYCNIYNYHFTVVLPLNLKYIEVVANSVIEVLIQNDNLNYTALYNKVKEILGHNLSHRDFNDNLKSMVEEKIVIKKDGSGKRGAKVLYII
jgi:hypothetical protein